MIRHNAIVFGAFLMSCCCAAAQDQPQQPNFELKWEGLIVPEQQQNLLEPSRNIAKDIFATEPTFSVEEAIKNFSNPANQQQKVEASRIILGKSFDPTAQKDVFNFLRTQNDTTSLEQLSIAYEFGRGTKIDYIKALDALQKAADQGSPSALADLGNRYQIGLGTLKNYHKAFDAWSKWTASPDTAPLDVKRDLAQAYQFGWGTDADFSKSEQLWKSVVSDPQSEAKDFLGYARFKYETEGNQALEEVLKNLDLAAQKDDPLAASLGFDFALEKGSADIQAKRAKLVELSMKKEPAASLRLGEAFISGEMGPSDALQGIQYFKAANQQGDPRGAAQLAKLWLDASITDPNGAIANAITEQEARNFAVTAAVGGDPVGLGQLARIQVKEENYINAYRNVVVSKELSLPANKADNDEVVYRTCAVYLTETCATVPVFYFTNRVASPDEKIGFVGEIEKSGKVKFGFANVTIPTTFSANISEKNYIRLVASTLANVSWGGKSPLPEAPKLEETDVNTSISPGGRGEFLDLLKKTVDKRSQKKVLIFIHGYNNSFVDAARRTALIAEQFKYPGVPVLLSWPSAGQTVFDKKSDSWFPNLAYTSDATSVDESCKVLRPVLKEIVDRFGPDNVIVLGHSMGNRLINYMMSTCPGEVSGPDDLMLGKVIMASPDVDVGALTEGLNKYRPRYKSLTLYAMANDFALRTAEKLPQSGQRAGIGGDRLMIIEKMSSVDATSVEDQVPDRDPLNHSSFFDVPQVKQDLYELMRWSEDATSRRCTVEYLDKEKNITFWRILPACLS